MNNQYNVVIVGKESDPWNAIAGTTQRVLPYDQSGNPNRWVFSREKLAYVGDCIVLKTLDESTAQTAFDALKGIEGVIALEPTVSTLEKAA